MEESLKKFGKYFLLDKIAQGGMAEIYRARLASTEISSRLIVIKRIQSEQNSNVDFLKMFKSEINVTMGFNHPNIVQLYDFGEENNQPFIVMELVEGKNIKEFMRRFSDLNKTFPIELAVYIVEQAASGLHYAHTFKDKISGESLEIVHRDISPQNILISYNGIVKIIDFGIAKATTNVESTRVGIIKGKPSYLSPEQILGETLDGRSDIFSLGIVLWETLVGKKLFAAENDLATLKLIENCQNHIKAPSFFNPKIPKELDEIVLKSLEKQKTKRFQTGEEMQKALHKFLYYYMPEFSISDLASCSKSIFSEEIKEDQKKIQQLNEKAQNILLNHQRNNNNIVAPSLLPSLKEELSLPDFANKINKNEKSDLIQIKKELFKKIEIEKKDKKILRTLSENSKKENKKSSKSFKFFIFSIFFLGLFFLYENANTLIFSDAFRFIMHNIYETIESQQIKNHLTLIEKEGLNLSKKSIILRLNIIPGGGFSKISLNEKNIDNKNLDIPVDLDSPLELKILRSGYKNFQRDFVIESTQVAGLTEWMIDVPLEPLHYGFISLKSTPSATAIIPMEENTTWKYKTPLENEKLPTGNYVIRLSNPILGMEKVIQTTIEEGKSVNFEVKLDILK
jgi:serine/threonine-protein kinase